MKKVTIISFLLVGFFMYSQQKMNIKGVVTSSNNKPLSNISVYLKNTTNGTFTDNEGKYHIKTVKKKVTLVTSATGYESKEKTVVLKNKNTIVNFILREDVLGLDEVVVTGTKTAKRKTESPVVVNVLNSSTLSNLQVCNLSESLKFQPGLRIETDCQTCNYTQLRMNGLQGGYSQILINGRPIFSPLMSLYGMEQLPVNMIDRIEVIRGGGSSLYGSSAIGGTVNVITKIPTKNGYELNASYQNTKGKLEDYLLNGNTTWVNEDRNLGVSFFLNHRERGFYDANNDNFSEIPNIENTSVGTNIMMKPTENQKIEISLSNLNEYRFGGEMVTTAAHLAKQSEERKHKIWMGSIDYQLNFNNYNSSFIAYSAWQNTDRKHYTGIFPDEPEAIENHLKNPPYGTSNTTTLQGGLQLNHKLNKFLGGENVFTFGTEYVSDKVLDEIKSYRYLIDQHTKDWGTFIQSDWKIIPSLNLLSGLRVDKHNLVNNAILSPRFALLYKYKKQTQFRLSYGTGFRAPQAFDTDLHIAFAGGGVSRVQLSKNLKEERSQSWSASINYDKPTNNYVIGYTIEGFYTHLKEAFYLSQIGTDDFGDIFEKQNGKSATVQGVTFELRANYNRKVQLEAGFTAQSSKYKNAVEYIQGVTPTRNFMRTPNTYGFANISFTPNRKWKTNMNFVYTGKMDIAHVGGADNFTTDKMVTTPSFLEVNSKLGYTFHLHKYKSDLELYGGVKNIFDSYQNDFDKGKNRDSNYIYGPAQPRTLFIGIRLTSE